MDGTAPTMELPAAETALPQRAVGEARLMAHVRSGVTRIAELRHGGSSRLLFPAAPNRTGAPLDAVLLNTAGGVTGGDRFEVAASAGPGSHVRLATQAAERAYRALPDAAPGALTVRLEAGPGARLAWLPQETILFDGARLARRIEAEVAPDATLLLLEPLVFGRTARGERLRSLHLTDQWRIRRGGALAYADALRVAGDAEAILSRPATLAGHRAMATLVYVAPDAEARLAALRAALPETMPATAGASLVRPGALAARLVAADGFALRQAVLPALGTLLGAALPKVWRL